MTAEADCPLVAFLEKTSPRTHSQAMYGLRSLPFALPIHDGVGGLSGIGVGSGHGDDPFFDPNGIWSDPWFDHEVTRRGL